MRKAYQLIFFGNYFYGLCAIGLALEASLQQRISIPSAAFFSFIFFTTVWFYTEAYRTEVPPKTGNERTAWYFNNRNNIAVSQWIYILIASALFLAFIIKYGTTVRQLTWLHYALFAVFPLAGMLYYGLVNIRLRDIGWLKP